MTAPTPLDRSLDAFRKLVRHVFPASVYWIVHEYTVEETDGLTFAGRPTDADFSPQLPTRIPYAPALPGACGTVPIGTLAYVGFANADPGKPFLLRFAPGATSSLTTIDADEIDLGRAQNTVIRAGDNVTIGSATGVVILNTGQGSPPTVSKVKA